MERILLKIDEAVSEYESGQFNSLDTLLELQRKLSSNMYFLTKYNIEAFTKWNGIVYNHDGSNASGITLANQKVPELRMTRKILEAGKNVSIGISNELHKFRE